MTTSRDDLAATTLLAHDVGDVDLEELSARLTAGGVVRIRGLFAPAAARDAKARVAARFDPTNDRKHDARDTEAVRRNFQKLVVGGISGTDQHRALARFLRLLYNPIFAEDIYGMRETFVKLARLRNRLYGLREDFAIHGTDDGYWTASRIHQYPRGGGFMVPHRDLYSREAASEAGARYAQVFLVLSEKGTDFAAGGAFIERDGVRFEYEEGCVAGDVIVYDGGVVHGVSDVDPLAPLDLATFSGRIVAFASLYRHLTPGDGDYLALAERAKRFDDAPAK